MLCAILLSVLFVSAQETGDGCRRCDYRGALPCKGHSEELLAYEAQVLFCSLAAACEDCAGALLVDCKHCEGGPDSPLIGERQAAVAEWLGRDPLGEHLGRSLPRVETTHFQLIVDTGVLKRGKRKVDPHLIMHLVASDVEFVAERIGAHYGVGPSDYFAKMRMWVWKDPADHRSVMEKFLFSTSTGDFKLLGKNPVFSVWTEKPHFADVPQVRGVFAHNAAHMLLSNLYRQLWVGDVGGGWFDAGLGHWYEYERFQRSVNYCIEEATLPLDYHGGLWRAPIRKRLEREEERVLPRLLPMNTGAMELPDQALCWSFYDWLVAVHPAALPVLLRGLKQQEEARELLEEALGSKVLAIEEDWRAWVSRVYPLKGDKPRESRE